MKRSHFLRVSSILCMLSGLVRVVFGIMAANYFSTALSFGAVSKEQVHFANVTVGVLILGSLAQEICGFKGAMNWEERLRAGSCACWGGGTLLLCLVGNILQMLSGYGASFVTWTTGFVVPGLYFAAALHFFLRSRKG